MLERLFGFFPSHFPVTRAVTDRAMRTTLAEVYWLVPLSSSPDREMQSSLQPKHSCLRAVALQQHLPKGLLPDRIRPLREVATSTGAVGIRLPKKILLAISFSCTPLGIYIFSQYCLS